jgi:hypothetical protein
MGNDRWYSVSMIGRPASKNPKCVQLNVGLTADQAAKLIQLARERGVRDTELVRLLLDEEIKRVSSLARNQIAVALGKP